MHLHKTLFSLAALLAASTQAFAQFCDAEVFALSPTLQSQFGSTLTISPNEQLLAVGSPFGVGPTGCSSGTVNVFERSGSGWVNVAELVSPNAECDGQFGYDVSMIDGRIAVGAPFEDVNGVSDAGRTYLFARSGGSWVLTQTLTEFNLFTQGRFGHSVSLNGIGLAISSIRSGFFGPSAGAVYVFRRGGTGSYLFEDRLAPNPPQPGAFFGTSVSLFGTNCAVGAVYENTVGTQSGAAYLFRQQPNGTWDQEDKLIPPTTGDDIFYGIAVATAGPYVVVGAEGAGPSEDGRAYVYRRAGTGAWNLESTLQSPAPALNGTFGRAVAMDGTRAVVTDFTSANGGSATVFERIGSSWLQSSNYELNDPSNPGAYGTECAIRGGTLAVGAPLRTGAVPFAGSALVYALDFEDCNANGENDLCELASFGAFLDCDGNGAIDTCEIATNPSLDCDGNGILDACEIATFPQLDCDGNGALDACEIIADSTKDCDFNGTLDVCDIAQGTATDQNGNLVIDACEALGASQGCQTLPNSTGQPGTLRAIGSGLASANDVALIPGDIPLDVFGFPIVSRSPGSNLPANAVGFLCLGGTIGRDLSNIFNSGLTGTPPALPVDIQLIPQASGSVAAVAGDTWYWQVWHRDVFAGQNTSTFTDSIRIDFQ